MNGRLVPELIVSDLAASLRFWRDLLGFAVVYDRPEEGFAYLSREGVSFMLEQRDRQLRSWVTGPLERPLGRGINFEVTLASTATILSQLREASWPLFMEPEEKWYRAGDRLVGVRQFLVQDPDGYLLRFAEPMSSSASTLFASQDDEAREV